MDKQTKYLLVGAILAVLILLGGYATSIYDNSQLSSLVDKCKMEAPQAPKSRGLTDEEVIAKAKAPWLDSPLVCDPDVLSKLRTGDEVGIQKQIIESLSISGHTFNDAKIIALFVFLLFSSPYARYFLLRRIREFRDAVTGK
jgi:hypothetical protein